MNSGRQLNPVSQQQQRAFSGLCIVVMQPADNTLGSEQQNSTDIILLDFQAILQSCGKMTRRQAAALALPAFFSYKYKNIDSDRAAQKE